MKEQKPFKKYYNRLAKEGILKSLLFGIALACLVYCALVLVMWFTEVDWLLWVAIAVFAVVLTGTTLLFYYTKYRPTAKAIAARVDRLGLEERLITMMELQNDDSFIALRQREDALASMQRVEPRQLKIVLPAFGIVFASLLFLCGTSMTVVTALAQNDIIDNPVDNIIDPPAPDVYYTVSYKVFGITSDGNGGIGEGIVGMGGMIEGLEDQLLRDGDTAEQVTAVADEEWAFIGWSDGYEDPVREDVLDIDALLANNDSNTVTVNEDGEIIVTYYAYFMELTPSDDPSDEPMEGDPDAPMDEPQDPSDSDGGKNDPNGDPSDDAGGRYDDANQVIDDDQYYRDRYEEYYNQAMEILASGGEVPQYLKDIIESYYGIIL